MREGVRSEAGGNPSGGIRKGEISKMEDLLGPRNGREVRGGVNDGVAVVPLQNWLVPFLLLCLRDGGSYSHQLEEQLGELGFDELGPQEMYQILWRMEREGKVTCDRGGGGYRIPRRWYEITEAGKDFLEFWANSLEQHQEEIDLFLKTYADGYARSRRE